MEPAELAGKLGRVGAPLVLDVRSAYEYRSAHIPSAIHIPCGLVLLRLKALPKNRRQHLVVPCEHGPRAEIARLQLVLAGYKNVVLLRGHMAAWRRLGLPLTS